MAQITLTVDDLVKKELEKRDRHINQLKNNNLKLIKENTRLRDTLKAMSRAKDALIEAADWLEPYRYDDE